MSRLAIVVFGSSLLWPLPLSAQVNPVNDISGAVSVLTVGGDESDAARHTLIGWQIAVSQKIRGTGASAMKPTPISIVGDFGGQSKTLDDGSTLHVSQYMGGVRVRAGRIKTVAPGVRRVDPASVFVHALAGGTTWSAGAASATGFMMGYGGGVDVTPEPRGEAYTFGIRAQFDWLPARVDGAWSTRQFRLGVGVVLMVRYWD
jgi:hypothetical protein